MEEPRLETTRGSTDIATDHGNLELFARRPGSITEINAINETYMGHQQWASTGHRGHPARVREHETPLGIGRPQEMYSLSLGRDFAATCKRGHRMACRRNEHKW